MELTVMNRQRKVRLDLAWLRDSAERSLAMCAAKSGDGRFALKALPAVEVAVVSDATIERVHVDFMGIKGVTDVITFDHGEIVVSAETGARCAKEQGHSVEKELALYVIHGLLHLNGFDDITPRERKAMHRVQDRIWRAL